MNLPMCASLVLLGNCQEMETENRPILSHSLEQFNWKVGNGPDTAIQKSFCVRVVCTVQVEHNRNGELIQKSNHMEGTLKISLTGLAKNFVGKKLCRL